ncbi:TPA: hypothetical protein I1T43_002325 [Staphylococcus aureus]|nr:hypothetical protein [Staphylococcus aureus]
MSLVGVVNELELKQVALNPLDRNLSNRYMKSQKNTMLFSYLLLIVWFIVTCITAFHVDTTSLFYYNYIHKIKMLGYTLILLMILGDIGTVYWFEKMNREIGKILKKYVSISDGGIATLKTQYYNILLNFKVDNIKNVKAISFKTTWSLYMYMCIAFHILVLTTMIILLTI